MHHVLKGMLWLKRSTQTAAKWSDLVSHGGSTSTVIDVHGWLARTTLDAMGAGIPVAFSGTQSLSDES